MDTGIVFQVEGFDTLRAAFAQAPDLILPIAEEAIDNALRAVYAVAEPYPPETIANSPQNPKGKWYERHFGPRWVRVRGLDTSTLTKRSRVNVYEAAGLVGGRNTSEQLQLRWRLNKAEKTSDGIEGSLENTASYAAAVVGPLDVQSAVMKEIGWKSIDDDLAESDDTIDAILHDMLDHVVAEVLGA